MDTSWSGIRVLHVDDELGFGFSFIYRVGTAHGWTIDVTDGSDGCARFEVAGVHAE